MHEFDRRRVLSFPARVWDERVVWSIKRKKKKKKKKKMKK
jgi:hypothetical protein